MIKRRRLCIAGIFCLSLFGLGFLGLMVLATCTSRQYPLIALTSEVFYCSGLIGLLAVSAVLLMNSRWFKNRCGEIENRKGVAAARRKRLNLIRILCLLLFALGLLGFYLLSLRFSSLARWLCALLVLTSVAFYYSGLIGFMASLADWLTNSRWFMARYGDFENRLRSVYAGQKRLNPVPFAVLFLCLHLVCCGLLLFGITHSGDFGGMHWTVIFGFAAAAVSSAGLIGFILFPLLRNRKRPEGEDTAESEDQRDAAPSRKFRSAVLIAVGALCPALFLLSIAAPRLLPLFGFPDVVWLGGPALVIVVFFFFAAGPVGSGAVLRALVSNRNWFCDKTSWLEIVLLLLLLFANTAAVFPLSFFTTLEFLNCSGFIK